MSDDGNLSGSLPKGDANGLGPIVRTLPAPEPTEPDIPVRQVVLWLCEPCLNGEGGECHSPGCALWLNRAPDIPIRGPFIKALDPITDDEVAEIRERLLEIVAKGQLSIVRPEPLRHVVVLTSPDGQRALSNASLMGAREAEAEAGQWRRRGWVAVVGEVT